ncbi:hypothetical protein FPANT_2424 [Fusarium pseudoanthophilum]|uniref:Uncharacterized protein n=1 Tax=Fusarium pseudoanthophilum TaxID=48495 RepID=A0A8H5UX28_9HYPO|nr:hypothetical protein FPANT_2424 [Fusarium pseudoanthophilum]
MSKITTVDEFDVRTVQYMVDFLYTGALRLPSPLLLLIRNPALTLDTWQQGQQRLLWTMVSFLTPLSNSMLHLGDASANIATRPDGDDGNGCTFSINSEEDESGGYPSQFFIHRIKESVSLSNSRLDNEQDDKPPRDFFFFGNQQQGSDLWNDFYSL